MLESGAAGWNTAVALSYNRGITLYTDHNAAGYTYDYFSGLYEFALAGEDKTNNIVTVKAP